MNPPRRFPPSLSLRSIKTWFAIRFLRSLKKISSQKCTRRSSYHKVKSAADSSMACVVGQRRAWSRALILKMNTRLRVRGPVVVVGSKKKTVKKKKKKTRTTNIKQISSCGGQQEQLRKIIPGGEAMDALSLLEETADYIKCLSAQVMVMTSIVDYCST